MQTIIHPRGKRSAFSQQKAPSHLPFPEKPKNNSGESTLDDIMGAFCHGTTLARESPESAKGYPGIHTPRARTYTHAVPIPMHTHRETHKHQCSGFLWLRLIPE